MRSRLNIKLWPTLGVLILGLAPGALAQSSNMGCGYNSSSKPSATLKPASLVLVSKNDWVGAPITGFWKVQAALPDGTVIDDGYATWHADGTEIINSSRPPISGNFCMGVWKRTGRSTYKLNHFALSWDVSGTLVGPAQIREDVTLDHKANHYVGTFTIDQFDVSGNLLAHIAGKVIATRVTVNTPVGDVL